jgi:hypothetical protein
MRSLGANQSGAYDALLITPIGSFYRELRNEYPRIEPGTWCLSLLADGARPVVLSYADLCTLPATEIEATVAGVQQRPGSELISHGRWRGVPMQVLMQELGAPPHLSFACIHSADGRDVTLTSAQLNRALLAYALNGEQLPHSLGAPARLIVVGAYAHKSPGWVTRIALRAQPIPDYWERLGRISSDEVATQSHIAHPSHGAHVSGTVPLHGRAYAGLRKITSVEISIDEADWTPVSFTPSKPGIWCGWCVRWQAPAPGSYSLRVRASDDCGFTQAHDSDGLNSSGCSAIHRITIHVDEP